ncbi:MAG: 23S rRNA (guanosine(2251)-2'-O)-methyltransferase RlmB [Firmicutes bacterium]|nr:23S rRNA (guanosine(2251)-2'-O)-methyltransferase RlmB [Bacillota bacterium]
MNDKIIGRNTVAEAIKAGREIDKLLIKKGEIEGSLLPIIKKAKSAGIPVIECDRQKLDQLAEGGNHQGIVAYTAVHSYASVSDILSAAEKKGHEPFIIILDKITDPHNLGSILRTANCVGADGVIIPKRNSVNLNSVVAKTSAGAIEYTPVAKVTNIAKTIDELKKKGMWIAGAEAGGTNMYETDLSGSVALLIGSEGEGISRLVREKCDFIVEIPMYGDINSLNASVAAAVLMYEVSRQRDVKILTKN